MARKKPKESQPVKKTLIVFSEGEKTEPNYLSGYKSDFCCRSTRNYYKEQ